MVMSEMEIRLSKEAAWERVRSDRGAGRAGVIRFSDFFRLAHCG